MNLARPLLVSTDTELIDECSRLAAVSGAELHVIAHARMDRSRWVNAPIVLIDVAESAGGSELPRRSGVIVVTRGSHESVDPAAWRAAVTIGAEQVACLPEAESWLIERLSASADEPSREGRILAVMPATGGAGASTLAAACAVEAASRGNSSLLVDGDRLGGGIDLVLGGEEAVGIRWPELADTRGRLAPAAFRQALPVVDGAAVLSWDREGSPEATPESWNAVLDASTRGFDLTVIDLPRHLGPAPAEVLSRARPLILVVSARVRGAIAAARCLEEVSALTGEIRVIVRERPGGVRPESIGQILGVPILGTIPVGAAFEDDGRLPRIPDAVIRACLGDSAAAGIASAA
ncbi:MAG: septum site-determining protein Ssd [Candidatus Nanopelagicales bacterium]